MLQSKLLCWNQKHALYGRMHPFQELSFQILSFSGIVFSDLIPYPFQELSFQTLSFSGIIFPDFYPFQELSYQNRSFSGSIFSDKKVSQRIFSNHFLAGNTNYKTFRAHTQ